MEIVFSQKMIMSNYCEITSSHFTDIYRLLPNDKCDPSIQLYQRVDKQIGLNLDIMARKTMLKQLSVEADYLFYRKVHDITDRNHTLKMRIFDQKEPILTLFSLLHKQLETNVNFLPFEDRTFLEKA